MRALSRKAEDLLKEILDHRNGNSNCDIDYWNARFEGLSGAEDALLRSLFKELEEADMISAFWADDYPYIMHILSNGISYFEEKQNQDVGQNNNSYTNIFYGITSGVQIQQGTTNSTQAQNNGQSFDESKIHELIETIKRYDPILENEYGRESAEELRKTAEELNRATFKDKDHGRVKKILSYIRDLSVNAGGGLIAAGIIQMVSMIVG